MWCIEDGIVGHQLELKLKGIEKYRRLSMTGTSEYMIKVNIKRQQQQQPEEEEEYYLFCGTIAGEL
ncbi:hypothetical protein T07_7958 [Trichinella nelsoni]|uniref:Uncharacterized protein n=1 Tax=Trichinella nelsoni TaxID=6336 RepID=A0A0V0SKK3_9BILA|nr:hypothetical protein T07_7958 [Trichinella nelsoni]